MTNTGVLLNTVSTPEIEKNFAFRWGVVFVLLFPTDAKSGPKKDFQKKVDRKTLQSDEIEM